MCQTKTNKTTLFPLPTLFDFPINLFLSNQNFEAPPLWGHALESIDSTNTLRIILQNPNGVKPNPSDLEFQYSLTACHDIGSGIICLPETNTSWNQFNQSNNTRKIMS
jgi:hypothetical protein